MKRSLINFLGAFYMASNCFLLFACNNEDKARSIDEPKDSTITKTETTSTTPSTYKFSSQPYGQIGKDKLTQFTISNPSGMTVKIINYGGTVTNIMVPDKNGNLEDVVLGFDSIGGYLQKGNPYMGCLVGRYANRIASGKFTLNGKTYSLAKNNNGNSLHGGLMGFDKVIWGARPMAGDSSLILNYTSPDGEEGYPGTVSIEVRYTLTYDNSLKIEYTATTDKSTVINLTNHSYFNLSAGRDSTILEHELMLNSESYTAVNDNLVPTGDFAEVAGGAMDFSKSKIIGKDITQVKGGYDHNWVISRKSESPELIGTLYHAATGRQMEIFTTEPGVQFYTGNFLDGTLVGKNRIKYIKHAGLCLETQHFPDSPNQPSFPSTTLNPEQTYRQITIYKFSTK